MRVFLFTDIESSTKLWREQGDAMRAALACHDAVLGEVIPAYGGRVVKHTGDGVLAVFDDGDPLGCALELQRVLQGRDWEDISLRVRVALHGGEAEERAGDFFGPTVNRAARLRDAAWGGQILVSQDVVALALPPGAELRDLGVHLLKDLGEPERIFQLVAVDLPLQDFPALRALSTRPCNLPHQGTPFVGREKELAAVAGLIGGEHCRLLTLLGPGGTGKTRLAIQSAAELVDNFTWGVHFVPLVSASTAEHIPAAVAAVLGYNFQGTADPAAQLYNYLADKDLLLVLDNLEHLGNAAAFVADLIDRAPLVKVVATSRRRLGLHAECVVEIGGMSYPRSSGSADIEASSAARLFAAAAARVTPSFRLEPAAVPALLRICERVGGTPLALELAAAWTPVLTIEEIAAELEIGFDLLVTEAADVAARHRSIRAVCDYSYGLLSPAEGLALTRLSVFRAPFTREAALLVGGATLPALTALVNKSLVKRAGPGLYSFHDLVKGYAWEKLSEDKAALEAALGKYRRYIGAFMENRLVALGENRQKEAATEVTAALDDVRAVLAAAVELRDADLFTQIAPALNRYYSVRGLFAEAKEVFSKAATAFAAADGTVPSPKSAHRAAYRDAAASLGVALARAVDPAAPRLLARVIGLGVRDRHTPTLISGLNNLAFFAFVTGRLLWAARLMETGLKYAGASGEPLSILPYLTNLGAIHERLGNYDRARELLNDAYAMAGRLGNTNAQTVILHNCGSVEAALGDDDAAETSWAHALVLARELDNVPMAGVTLASLGELYLRRGRGEPPRISVGNSGDFKDPGFGSDCKRRLTEGA
jgi:predicted ATPase/class 3 adenylate cyclase